MQSIMVMSTKGDNMGIFKKIWYWLFDSPSARDIEVLKSSNYESSYTPSSSSSYDSGSYSSSSDSGSSSSSCD